MPRTVGPWPRKQRNGGTIYYAYVGTKQVSLRTADEGEAWDKYRSLQHGLQPQGSVKVAVLVERYLENVQGRVKPQTVKDYRDYLDLLTTKLGLAQAGSVTKGQVESIGRKTGWGSTTRTRFITVVKQVFRFAEAENMIPRNPLKGLKGPGAKSRGAKAVITEEEYEHLLLYAESVPDLYDFLVVLWETGARPSELTGIRAMNVDHVKQLVMLTEHKMEGKGKTRRILLSERANGVLKQRSESKPMGSSLLWVNSQGERLTRVQLGSRFQRLKDRAGLSSPTLYGFRHSFATRMLMKDVSETKVAALLGHTSTAMLHKHYSHIIDETDELHAALKTGNS